MRTLLSAALLALALAAPAARAQLIPSFGVAGGLNFASLGDATGLELDNSTGFHAGVFADLGFGGLAVRPGVFFVRAGSVQEEGATEGETVNYLAIPVDVRLGFPSPVVQPYAVVGPEARVPLSEVFTDDNRSFALAANVGVGAKLSGLIGPQAFAELRYGIDLSGLQQGASAEVNGAVKVNLFMIRVGVGL